jgi:DNA adenine methylase
MGNLAVPRPFLKWAGGKKQLADALLARMPVSFKAYHEPFVGSGALFFRMCRQQKIGHAVLSDLNAELIDTYRAVRDCAPEVIQILSEYPHNPDFFYSMRSKDPWKLGLPERAARMIYLNKTGYNGLYRVNRQGKFNVPFGRYKLPRYLDRKNLLAVSQALQNIEILCQPFEAILGRAQPGDWVYFDPPYVPLSPTANFTSYYASGFGPQDQERLRDVCMELSRKEILVTLSNSDTEITRLLYPAEYFAIAEVLATRAINCNAARRGKITELVITNYPVKEAVPIGQKGSRL